MTQTLFKETTSQFIYQSKERSKKDLNSISRWKIAIIDDDNQIHKITKHVLNDVTLSDRRLQFLSAHTYEQARQLFSEHDDIVLALLDVTMEKNNSGFELAKFIRSELNEWNLRIVFRTGLDVKQRFLDKYDISSYIEKGNSCFTVLEDTVKNCILEYTQQFES